MKKYVSNPHVPHCRRRVNDDASKMVFDTRHEDVRHFIANLGYTSVPNHFLDRWAPTLTATELRCCLWAFRCTVGWGVWNSAEREDANGFYGIASILEQTALSRNTFRKVVKALEARGLMSLERKMHGVYSVRISPAAMLVPHEDSADGPAALLLPKDLLSDSAGPGQNAPNVCAKSAPL